MGRKDIYHQIVIEALQKDGWTITDDPLMLAYGQHRLYVDLGAERSIAAQKDGQLIAVEIKSFINQSAIYDLYLAVGQYAVYQTILSEKQASHRLFLAIPKRTRNTVFMDELGTLILARQQIKLLVFDEDKRQIIEWTN